jgi:hypothetical protein
MNTAEYTASLPVPTIASLSHATPQEMSLYTQFARHCLRTGGWETLSCQYLAMKEESVKRGLRACSFRQFRNVIRIFSKVGFPSRCSPPYGFGAMSISRRPKLNYRDLAAGWRWSAKSGE